ncbi:MULTISPECIES: inositol monophosphatase family protein [Leuconostoc]|uniref:Inositol-1-monophosphatase n=2 Tax=Leuconostoc TaxID=1243 RepID=A0AAN2QUM8_9LACO|nr:MULTISPECIES: inositol monophosphatase family protein [Leuconostoc]MBZ5948010.1 inositol monophosphatase family protein [Leuconostoc gasicomitatum]MBZ5952863.1 inositol monophosphatase family protein [Leuconostoc gasicomitatum]MBZ5954913.1 inositol monophosphatase family protein [Leuconostoc gasicomitatum]MBZ5957569.1 inositol monophosphatase family protein [Leuconostoc gasicomitatum]MBZ5960963.1 inositol monophosphatase family protein [Leuconostoc gasicomitatum]
MTLSQFEIQDINQTVLLWLDEVRKRTLIAMQQHLDISIKHDARDLVTNVDRDNEQFLNAKIRSYDSEASIVSEEGFGDHQKNMQGNVWFVDPIDGTMNFVKEQADFAVMIALYIDNEPVLGWILDVVNNVVYHGGPQVGVFANQLRLEQPNNDALSDGIVLLSGARLLYGMFGYDKIAKAALGYRVIGAAGPSFLRVISGRAVGYSSKMMPWDFAAGQVLAKTLGLSISDIDGRPLDMLSSNIVLVATNRAHRDILMLHQS